MLRLRCASHLVVTESLKPYAAVDTQLNAIRFQPYPLLRIRAVASTSAANPTFRINHAMPGHIAVRRQGVQGVTDQPRLSR